MLTRLALPPAQFYRWKAHYGCVNARTTARSRPIHGLTPEERQAILAYHDRDAPEAYRRLEFMMLDAGVVAVRWQKGYRVLRAAGAVDRGNAKPPLKERASCSRYGPASTATPT